MTACSSVVIPDDNIADRPKVFSVTWSVSPTLSQLSLTRPATEIKVEDDDGTVTMLVGAILSFVPLSLSLNSCDGPVQFR